MRLLGSVHKFRISKIEIRDKNVYHCFREVRFSWFSWFFSSLNTVRTLARFPNESSKYSRSITASLRKNTYGTTSMAPNQNVSIWMALPPTETHGAHQLIMTPSLVFTPSGTFHNHKGYWRELQNWHHRIYRRHGSLRLHQGNITDPDNLPHWEEIRERIENCMGGLPRALG